MTRIKREPVAWPAPFLWLPKPIDQVAFRILERSRLDVGILETAPNRGPEIDLYLSRAHVPKELIEAGKGNWCAAWVGAMLVDAGASVPRDYGSCDAWLPYMTACPRGDLPNRAKPGDVVLYGKPRVGGAGELDAVHIGILWRLSPAILSIEGNRGLGRTATNNGVAVDVDLVARADVLGFVRPELAA
jgi:hypothetical protein